MKLTTEDFVSELLCEAVDRTVFLENTRRG
jgi:hypothetical protein